MIEGGWHETHEEQEPPIHERVCDKAEEIVEKERQMTSQQRLQALLQDSVPAKETQKPEAGERGTINLSIGKTVHASDEEGNPIELNVEKGEQMLQSLAAQP